MLAEEEEPVKGLNSGTKRGQNKQAIKRPRVEWAPPGQPDGTMVLNP